MTVKQLIKLLRRYPRKATVQVVDSAPRITIQVDQNNHCVIRFDMDEQPQSNLEKENNSQN